MAELKSDYDLVKSFIQGDQAAFNEIVNRYKQKIYWHARRMTGNHLDADEILQEVFIVLFNKLKDFQFKSSLYTWIYKITSTRSLNYIKKRKAKEFLGLEDKFDTLVSSGNEVVKDIENKEKLKKLDEVLQKLPSKQREIFIYRNFEELSYEEIAEITGKSIGGLKANYFHAIQKITELMGNYE